MRIVGPDRVVFGVKNLADCHQYLVDYGLTHTSDQEMGGNYDALDGTGVSVFVDDDPSLPPPLPTGNTLRQVIWGCEDQAAVDEVAAELGKDREIDRKPDGSFWCQDLFGFEMCFQVTQRKNVSLQPEQVNSPGSEALRKANVLGTDSPTDSKPRTLSHVVFFAPDADKMEDWYRDRLGFITTDKFTGLGPFMRTKIHSDHHSVFFMTTPPHMQGLEHIAFHLAGPNELMIAGTRFKNLGYESFWGPGRHIFGSNYFWYFNSPFGAHFEYDADMDLHDDTWVARHTPPGPAASQTFLFQSVPKWMPGGDKDH